MQIKLPDSWKYKHFDNEHTLSVWSMPCFLYQALMSVHVEARADTHLQPNSCGGTKRCAQYPPVYSSYKEKKEVCNAN